MNNPDSPDTNILQDVLDILGLHNHITFPTHRLHNTPVLIITEHQESFIKKLNQGRLFLNHYLINFEMALTSTSVGQKISTFRKMKSINWTAFAKEVQHQLNTQDINKINAEECIDIYHNILKTTLDNHTPLKSKVTSERPKLPWYSNEIGEAIQRHCKAEWDISNKDKCLKYYRLGRQVTNLLNESECTYYKNTLHEAKSNSKKMFTICNSLLGWNTSLPLPPEHSDSELAECFNIFLTSKRSRIRSELKDLRIGPPDTYDVNDQIPPSMDCFQPLTQEEVENVITTSPSKSCDLDPIPTTLLKDILPSVITILTEIINKSLISWIFPDRLKVALVRPLLKKANLNLIEKIIDRYLILSLLESPLKEQ